MTVAWKNVADLIDGTHGEVRRTPEFDRVFALPTKPETDWSAVALALTEHLGGVGMTLWPSQAEVLVSLADLEGAFASIPVGGGKTLISYLVSVLLDTDVVLLIPGSLREKTERDFEKLSRHWPATRTRIVTVEKLSRSDDLLEKIGCTVVVLDEAHVFKNLSAGCTKKLVRYLRAHPSRVVVMSGTITTRSILDYWHLLAATHGYGMPLPMKRSETAMWARAVDEKTEIRARPGAFSLLGGTSVETSRAVVKDRIFSTPGCLQVLEIGCPASIRAIVKHPEVPKGARKILAQLVKEKKIEEEECTPADVWRHTRTLVLGFANTWRYPAPKPWLAARKSWKHFAREILECGDPRFDTEDQVKHGCIRGDLPGKAWEAWDAVRRDFTPETIPRWYDDPVMPSVSEPRWIWCVHVAYAEEIERRLGLRYYHGRGFSRDGRFIHDHNPDFPAIVSVGSCHRGFNLQFLSRNTITTPPSTGKIFEQVIGRTHREGQAADVVEVEIWCTRQDADLAQAIADAEYIFQTTGARQKLLLADFV